MTLTVEADAVACLDSGVWIKFLVPEEPGELREAAIECALRSIQRTRIVAPAFAWAEVGSALRKKVRQGILRPEQAEWEYLKFVSLPIQYLDTPEMRVRTWAIAHEFKLPTLYDAAFLACTEFAALEGTVREFWTTDEGLLHALGSNRPAYVRKLGSDR